MFNRRTVMPAHPGKAFKELVIKPSGKTIAQVARELEISRETLSRLTNGRISLSLNMAERLAKYTDTSIKSWMNMQVNLDMWMVSAEGIQLE